MKSAGPFSLSASLGGVLLLGTILGCGSDELAVIPITGQVTLDGKPVAGAAVMFLPSAGGPVATGTTNEAGAFALTTAGRDGAPAGQYTVTVTLQKVTGVAADEEEGGAGLADPNGIHTEWIVPERYSNPEKSGLKAEVSPEQTTFKFNLTKPRSGEAGMR